MRYKKERLIPLLCVIPLILSLSPSPLVFATADDLQALTVETEATEMADADDEPESFDTETDAGELETLQSGTVYCDNSEDLLLYIEDDTITEIILLNDILINDSFNSHYWGRGRTTPLTIQCGNHTIATNTLLHIFLQDKVLITGSSTLLYLEKAVFYVDGGRIAAIGDNATAVHVTTGSILATTPSEEPDEPAISATGRYATAIYADKADTNIYQSNWDNHLVSIAAHGEGAAGIRATGSLSTRNLIIKATGRDSIGVHAAGDYYGRLCSVSADGTAIISDADEILLDCVEAEPFPSGAKTLPRTLTQDELTADKYITRGEKLSFTRTFFSLVLDDPASSSGYPQQLSVSMVLDWDTSKVDVDTPGSYLATSAPLTAFPFQPLDLKSEILEANIYVARDDRIQICYADRYGRQGVRLILFRPPENDTSYEIRYSQDEGETWSPLPEDVTVMDYGNQQIISGIDLDGTYQFYIMVDGGAFDGPSNIASYPNKKITDWNREGPRDGTGREPDDSGNKDNSNQNDKKKGGGNRSPLPVQEATENSQEIAANEVAAGETAADKETGLTSLSPEASLTSENLVEEADFLTENQSVPLPVSMSAPSSPASNIITQAVPPVYASEVTDTDPPDWETAAIDAKDSLPAAAIADPPEAPIASLPASPPADSPKPYTITVIAVLFVLTALLLIILYGVKKHPPANRR